MKKNNARSRRRHDPTIRDGQKLMREARRYILVTERADGVGNRFMSVGFGCQEDALEWAAGCLGSLVSQIEAKRTSKPDGLEIPKQEGAGDYGLAFLRGDYGEEFGVKWVNRDGEEVVAYAEIPIESVEMAQKWAFEAAFYVISESVGEAEGKERLTRCMANALNVLADSWDEDVKNAKK
jgi:hypothetical protein